MLRDHFSKLFLNLFKLFFAVGLAYWMWSSGKIDFSQLLVIAKDPFILFIIVAGWAFAIVGLGAVRWMLLLRGVGIHVNYFRVLQLNLIGLFFNSIIPGAVGGDLMKAIYVIRDQEKRNKTPAMLSILLDRIVGLMGLFTLGAISVSFNLSQFIHNDALTSIVFLIYVLFGFTLCFFALAFWKIPPERDIILRIVGKPIIGFSLLKKIYLALCEYRNRPWSLVQALLISMTVQSLIMMFFIYLTEFMNHSPVDFLKYAAVYPVGILCTALPLAPAGMGVGHVAFDSLYRLIGLKNGANVFNVYLVAQITLSLTGIIPYLLIKKRA